MKRITLIKILLILQLLAFIQKRGVRVISYKARSEKWRGLNPSAYSATK